MKQRNTKFVIALLIGLLLIAIVPAQAQDEGPIVLTFAAYTVPREAYGDIIPLFQTFYQGETGRQVIFQESYLASGAQSRAVAGGFEADVVALSLENDVKRLVNADLITHNWQDNPYNGFVSTSVVILVTRPGNPFGIEDWDDLAQEGLEVVTPDPATSGGAQWNVLGAYGAALRGQVEGYEGSLDGGDQFLRDLFTNVSVMDISGRESYLTFESGVGDVAITYENEYYASLAAGGEGEIVYPTSTILIENPVAVVDTYADAHGPDNRAAAEAFVNFLYTPEVQAIFAERGFRAPVEIPEGVDTSVHTVETSDAITAQATAQITALNDERFPAIENLYTADQFGGWAEIGSTIFGDEGSFTALIAEVKGQ